MADQKTIEQRVKEIIVNQLNVNEEQITPTASFLDDLGADSLDTVELIMAFEEEFKDEIKGEIPESDAEKLQTVGQVIDYIKAKAGKAGVFLGQNFWRSACFPAEIVAERHFCFWISGGSFSRSWKFRSPNAAS